MTDANDLLEGDVRHVQLESSVICYVSLPMMGPAKRLFSFEQVAWSARGGGARSVCQAFIDAMQIWMPGARSTTPAGRTIPPGMPSRPPAASPPRYPRNCDYPLTWLRPGMAAPAQ